MGYSATENTKRLKPMETKKAVMSEAVLSANRACLTRCCDVATEALNVLDGVQAGAEFTAEIAAAFCRADATFVSFSDSMAAARQASVLTGGSLEQVRTLAGKIREIVPRLQHILDQLAHRNPSAELSYLPNVVATAFERLALAEQLLKELATTLPSAASHAEVPVLQDLQKRGIA